MNISDTALLERWIHRRDPEAMAAIIKRHSAMVYATCRRVTGNATDAEDVAQECFLKLASVRHAGASLAGLLHTMATRLALNKARGDSRRRMREAEYTALNAVPESTTWDDVQPLIDEAIAALPEKRRTAVVRHFLQGETHAEIARDLGVSRAAVSQQVARGVDEVRETLRERGVAVLSASLMSMLAASRAGAVPTTLTAALGRLAVSGAGCGSGPMAAKDIVAAGWVGLLVKSLLGVAAVVGVAFVLVGAPPKAPERPPATAVTLASNTGPAGILTSTPSARAPLSQKAGSAVATSSPAVERVKGAGEIRVFVTDRTGQLVAGVTVQLETHDAKAPERDVPVLEIQSNGGGEAHFTEILWGRYRVNAQHEDQAGWAAAYVDVDNPVFISDLILKPAGAITGHVFDTSDAPIAGAEVALLDPRISSKMEIVVSRDDGSFAFTTVPLDSYGLQASASGYAPAISKEVGINAPPVSLVLDRGATLSGVVQRASNRAPVAEMPLRLTAEGFVDVAFTVASDARGAFQIENLPKGPLLITGDDPVRAMTPSATSVTMSPGQTVEVALLVETGAKVSGRVYDEDTGQPVAGVVVGASEPTYERRSWRSDPTDAEGRYSLTGLTPGSLVVTFYSAPKPYSKSALEAARQREVALQPGESLEGVDLSLTGGLMVCGVVVNERNEPVPGAKVSLGRATADGDLFDYQDTLAGADGAFCFANIWTGMDPTVGRAQEPQDLALEADYRGARSDLLWIRDVTDSVADARLKLLPQARGVIAGVVVNASGKPVVAALSLRHPYVDNHFDSGLSHTDVDGNFLFQDLAAGDYEIWASRDNGTGYSPGKDKVHALTLAPGQRVTDLRIALGETDFITGTIKDDTGTPLRGYEVEAWDVNTGDYSSGAFTDAEGRFKIAVHGDGTFELRPSESSPGGFWRKPANAGDDVQITLSAEVLQGTQPPTAEYRIDPETGEERVEWPAGSAGPPSSGE